MPCGARGTFYCVGAPFSSTSVHCTYYIHIPRQHTSPLDSSPCRGARARERAGVRSTRKSKTRNTRRGTRESRGSGRNGKGEETRWKMGGRRRKREAPNTQHNPAASSASMDFKRSPRLLLFPFLSFSFFYYYFRGVRSGWMRARARTSMCSPRVYQIGIYMLCVLVCTYICTRIRASVRVRSFQVELGRAWVGLDAWKPWTTLGRLVGFPPRLSARIEAHRHGSNVGTTAAA